MPVNLHTPFSDPIDFGMLNGPFEFNRRSAIHLHKEGELPEEHRGLNASMADLQRFRNAVSGMDPRSSLILTYHAALEAELARLLSVLLPRGELLEKMGFSNSVKVFQASFWAEPSKTDELVGFLRLFNEIRNAVAHGDRKEVVDRLVAKLRTHYAAMPGSTDNEVEPSLEEMVSDIAGTLAGLAHHVKQRRPAFP